MSKKVVSELSFENSLEELEGIVTSLESGELDLESSIGKFEEGVSLYKSCKKKLAEVEKKVTKLTQDLKEEEL